MGFQLEKVWQSWQGREIGPCGFVTLARGAATSGRTPGTGDTNNQATNHNASADGNTEPYFLAEW